MGKRFTDTSLWEKEWFSDLLPIEKLAWFYIKDRCDSVGVWEPNFKMAEFLLGEKIDWIRFNEKCNKNIEILPNGKWWLIDFCEYQYGELSMASRPHQSYIRTLERHGLLERVGYSESAASSKGIRSRITAQLRSKIYERDRGTCQYCNSDVTLASCVIDHFVPVSKGGTSDTFNLVLSCQRCNTMKLDLMPLDFAMRYKDYSESVKRVSNFLDTVLRNSERAKEKEEEKVKEEEKEEEKEDFKIAQKQLVEKLWPDLRIEK